MSEYTYVNIFSENPRGLEIIIEDVSYKSYVNSSGDRLFARIGKDQREKLREKLTEICWEVDKNFTYAVICRMEDTGNTHEFEVYEFTDDFNPENLKKIYSGKNTDDFHGEDTVEEIESNTPLSNVKLTF